MRLVEALYQKTYYSAEELEIRFLEDRSQSAPLLLQNHLHESGESYWASLAGLNLQEMGQKREPLRVRHIRRMMTAAESAHYCREDSFSRTAALAEDHQRLVYNAATQSCGLVDEKETSWCDWLADFLKGNASENRRTVTAFLAFCVYRYGEERALDAFRRYSIDIHQMIAHAEPLLACHVRRFNLGIADVEMRNCCELFTRMCRAPSFGRSSLMLAGVSEFEAEGVIREFSEADYWELRSYRSAEQLPPQLFNLLVNSLKFPEENHGLVFTGSRVHQLVTAMPSRLAAVLFYRPWDEDRDLLHEHPGLRKKSWPCYYEWLAKVGVKKHLYKVDEDGQSLRVGRLLPAPDEADGTCRWYRVARVIDTGVGKDAYDLEPACVNYRLTMPSIRIYRSTSMSPSARDTYTTWVSDTNPLACPGYWCMDAGWEEEKLLLTESSPRPLIILGHSLGGSQAQLAMVNLQRKTPESWRPCRPIRLELFDSPAIEVQDAQSFASWYRHSPFDIQIHYHMSAGDIISQSGWQHLGAGLEEPDFDLRILSVAEGCQKQELQLQRHRRHYYATDEDRDYKVQTVAIETFDEGWMRSPVEAGRRIGGAVLCPLIWGLGSVSRFFFGRRGHPSGISELVSKPPLQR